MRRALNITLAAAAIALGTLAAPAMAASVPAPTPTPANDPCSYGAVNGAIACQGYYGGNLITGITGSATTAAELTYINLLLTGTPSTADTLPTTNGSTYTGSYPGLGYSTVLGALTGLNGNATLDFGSLNLSGLTILGAHFGNNIESDPNNVTAFWLLDLGNSTTHSITLASGQGSSNAQIFATGGTPAVPEPATWAMMLLGFCGMGVAMRRGRETGNRLLQVA